MIARGFMVNTEIKYQSIEVLLIERAGCFERIGKDVFPVGFT